MPRALYQCIGTFVQLSTGWDMAETVNCWFRHARGMMMPNWWNLNFKLSYLWLWSNLKVVWCIHMQPRHSRAMLCTLNGIKRTSSARFRGVNASVPWNDVFCSAALDPRFRFSSISPAQLDIFSNFKFFADVPWDGASTTNSPYLLI